jgi:arylsulfatase A-like enzyme
MTRQPNIVFILADDMGWGDFSLFANVVPPGSPSPQPDTERLPVSGDGSLQTPALDALCGQGTCLTQHYSASAVCAPARAGLLTGRYPHRTGAIDTLEGRGLDRLALREVTLADRLRARGYATGLVGKWHLGALDPRYHPNLRGFDEFVGFRGGWHDYWDWWLYYNDGIRKSDGRYLTDVFTDESVDFIRRHKHEPFFLHVTYNAPHFPFQAPEAEVRPFLETGRYTTAVATIYAMIQRMDAGVGRILEELKKQGIEDNTLVIFTSDNGPQLGGSGDESTMRYNCGYNGAKGTTYEGGIRIPLVARWPDGTEGENHFHEMVHFVDWLPTLLAVAGADPGDTSEGLPINGQNVLPVLRGESGQVQTRRFWQWNRYTPLITGNAAMRDGAWKLVRPAIREAMQLAPEDLEMDRGLKYRPEQYDDIRRGPDPARDVPPPPPAQLFNIDDDPLEQHDLAQAEPARVEKMLAELETWFEAVEADRRSITD